MNTTAREIALLSLCRYERDGKYSNLEADSAIKKFSLKGPEKNLYTKLLYGTIERKNTLDYIISKISSKPIDELTVQMRNILRMSIYQMRYLDRVPDSAAVNEGVELAKKFVKPSSASFANAVLRKYASEGDKIKLPGKEVGIEKYLSVNYSVSTYVANSLVSSLGADGAERMLEHINKSEHYITLRTNTLVNSREELKEILKKNSIDCMDTEYSPFGVKIIGYVDTEKLFSIIRSRAFVEDEASQLAVCALDLLPGMTLVDCCAAPGGKTVCAAIEMQNEGKIYAFDLHENKLKLIKKAAEESGVDIISTEAHDGKEGKEELYGKADRVLCDVPCSNIGVIGKKPDVRYKTDEGEDRLISTQYSILNSACNYLKKGGSLVYSTCTVKKTENTEQVNRFISEHSGYTLVSEKTLTPHENGTDGFYIAVIKKND